VTSVLEWTKEETGVGALIAKGNHLLKGNWALLVKHPTIKIRRGKESLTPKEYQLQQKNKNKQTSPSRFVKRVTIAPFKEAQFK